MAATLATATPRGSLRREARADARPIGLSIDSRFDYDPATPLPRAKQEAER